MKILSKILIALLIVGCNEVNKNQDLSSKEKKDKQFNRHVELEGQLNFRDLGNYKSSNGAVVKTGLIYRSGTLSNLTDSDVERIKELNIKTVVNFLTEEEISKRGDDRLPDGVHSVYLPIAGENNEVADLLVARQDGNFSKIPADFNYKVHAMLVEESKEEYAQLFHLLSDPENYPIVFHCSHGIHRTGTAAALILSILDVDWETVREDYLLSNDYRKEEIEKRIADLSQLANKNPEVIDKADNESNIEAFYLLKGEYVDGTIMTVEDGYGSFNNYLNQIGVSDKEIVEVRNILLKH
jgi:protein-tyrosine phosphatase